MEAKIDSFGRILIPKKVRQAMGLRPGDRVFIERVAEEALIRPAAETNRELVRDGEALVFVGATAGDVDAEIDRLRDERLDGLGRFR